MGGLFVDIDDADASIADVTFPDGMSEKVALDLVLSLGAEKLAELRMQRLGRFACDELHKSIDACNWPRLRHICRRLIDTAAALEALPAEKERAV